MGTLENLLAIAGLAVAVTGTILYTRELGYFAPGAGQSTTPATKPTLLGGSVRQPGHPS